MKYANALLARLGLVAKADASDAFEARLRKLEQREAKRAGRQSLFRNQSTQQWDGRTGRYWRSESSAGQTPNIYE